MAVLIGWIDRSPLGGSVNPNITTALNQYTVSYWPPVAAKVGLVPNGDVVSQLPVSAAPRALDGTRSPAFSDDWYYRVHIRPQRLDLGNVLQAQTTTVKVWNAFFVPKVLTAISGLSEGLTVQGPTGLPATFAALQEQDWLVNVARQGAGRIDAALTWLFTAAAAPVLPVTGTRVVEWPLLPNWSDGMTERLGWNTQVLRSASGAEQRRALRLAPRRSFEASMLVEGRERALLDAMLAGWGARVWAIPVWPDVQLLPIAVGVGADTIQCATQGRDFRAGGLAMLIGDTAFKVESAEVLTVNANSLTLKRALNNAWPVGTRLFPARAAELVQQPSIKRITDRLSSVEVQFMLAEACDWPAALPTTLYRGAPVFANRPEESEDLTGSWQRLQLELDNSRALPLRTDTAGLGFNAQAHRWMLFGRSEQAAWRSLLYGLRGRQAAMWLPTHAEDLTLQATAGAAASALDVDNAGYSRFLSSAPVGRRDIRIELADGSALHRRITGSTELSADVERLALATPVGVQLVPAGLTGANVSRISYLQLARLDSDDIELHHTTDADGVATCQVMWRGVRDDLELAA
jgi:hypothetical protein